MFVSTQRPSTSSSNALVTSSDALVTRSFLFLVVMPGATSGVFVTCAWGAGPGYFR